eukprot:274248_1
MTAATCTAPQFDLRATQDGRPTPQQLQDAPEWLRVKFHLNCTVKLCGLKNDTRDADVRARLFDQQGLVIVKVFRIRNDGATALVIEFWNPKQATAFFEWLGGNRLTGDCAIPKDLRYLFRMQLLTVDKTDTHNNNKHRPTKTNCQKFAVHRATKGLWDRPADAKLDFETGAVLAPAHYGLPRFDPKAERYTVLPNEGPTDAVASRFTSPPTITHRKGWLQKPSTTSAAFLAAPAPDSWAAARAAAATPPPAGDEPE